MRPFDSNKIFNMALRIKSLPTPGLTVPSVGDVFVFEETRFSRFNAINDDL